jgi:hypothetical protein
MRESSNGVQVQMNKFTPVEVHDSNKKFAGWKSKPSNKMRFEANQYGTIYCGIHHGRSNRFQPAAQPADGVISRTIILSDCRLLLIVEERGGGLVHHLRDGLISGGRSHRSVALCS